MSIPSRCRYGLWAFTWTQTLGAWSNYHETSFFHMEEEEQWGNLYKQRLSSSAMVLQVTPGATSLYSHNFVRVSKGQRLEGSCQSLRRRAVTSLSCKANCRWKARVSQIFCLSFFLWFAQSFERRTFLPLPSFNHSVCDNFVQKVFQ